jgi:hypothetical protein
MAEIRIVADDEQVLVVAALGEQLLEVAKSGFGCKCFRNKDLRLVAGLGSDQGGGLEAALERARDDKVELNLQLIEDVRELQALALAVFVERTFDVEQGVGASHTGGGVPEKEEIHKLVFILEQELINSESSLLRIVFLRVWSLRVVVKDAGVGLVEGRRSGLGVGNGIGRRWRGRRGRLLLRGGERGQRIIGRERRGIERRQRIRVVDHLNVAGAVQ